jgi:hypothetical protein
MGRKVGTGRPDGKALHVESEATGTCDAIFVLAGGAARKAYGLQLYRQGCAPRIVLSVARFEIRRLPQLPLPMPLDLLSVARAVPPPERHFFVEFDATGVRFEKTRVGRFGTMAEIAALAAWCERNPDVQSVLVVSSGYHLRRVRMCAEALLPKRVRCAFVPTPGEAKVPATQRVKEALKLAGYRTMLLLGEFDRPKR